MHIGPKGWDIPHADTLQTLGLTLGPRYQPVNFNILRRNLKFSCDLTLWGFARTFSPRYHFSTSNPARRRTSSALSRCGDQRSCPPSLRRRRRFALPSTPPQSVPRTTPKHARSDHRKTIPGIFRSSENGLAHLHTTPPGIEGVMRPFDFAVLTHTNATGAKTGGNQEHSSGKNARITFGVPRLRGFREAASGKEMHEAS